MSRSNHQRRIPPQTVGGCFSPGLGGDHPPPHQPHLYSVVERSYREMSPCHQLEKEGRILPHDRTELEDSDTGRSVATSEHPESSLCSKISTASIKVKNIRKLSITKGHFPRLADCAHFHYDSVDFGSIQLSLADEKNVTPSSFDIKELGFLTQICCQGASWVVKRSYEDFRVLDKHLHLCIYDRRFSQLPELPRAYQLKDKFEKLPLMLATYLSRLSAIADNKINCGPVLTWMEIDNKGNHLLVHDESSINVPAIAAAHVIKRYTAQASDELSFEVGDIVSVIDMPPKEDTGWWRGKHGFQVGFFPYDCVELISEKIPPSVTNIMIKPVSKKHGKLITFLRSFMKSRPSKQKLKQRGIFRERVFGCDLGEHLLNSGHDVPQVIRSCTEFIEKHGVVDGIYRLSGITSNIQRLRHDFDSENIPDLTKEAYIQDIHSVGSLCKLYFRELPNPLLTYQLYDKFSDAVSAATDEERLVKIHDVIQQLPPPHYRTLEFLMRHLSCLAAFSSITNMHCKNLAIVWAPNLLRSKQIESACFNGTSAFMEVRIQSVVVEFIINHVDMLFSSKLNSIIRDGAGHGALARPKSLLLSSPSTKLLSLEEAQAQLLSPSSPHSPHSPHSLQSPQSQYIEVGEGPAALQGRFHTVIEFPADRKKKKVPAKTKKSPVGNWRSFFNLGKSSSTAKRKLQRHPSEPSDIKTVPLPGGRGDSGTLRSAKSEESLTSSHIFEGERRARRPLSTSDCISTSFNEELLDIQAHSNPPRFTSAVGSASSVLPSIPLCSNLDYQNLPDTGATLNFDPMSFQCSSPRAESSFPQNRQALGKRDCSGNTSVVVEGGVGHRNLEDGTVHTSATRDVKENENVKAPMVVAESVSSTPLTSSPSLGTEVRPNRSAFKCISSHSAANRATAMQPRSKQPATDARISDSPPEQVRPLSLISPPVKSAARLLALELAQSAQHASLQSQSTTSPTERHPSLRSPAGADPPLPPPLKQTSSTIDPAQSSVRPSRLYLAEINKPENLYPSCGCSGLRTPEALISGDHNHQSQAPAGPTAIHHCDSERMNPGDEARLCGGIKLKRSPLQPPTPPVRTLHSHLTTAALQNREVVNASNYRAVLAEASLPAMLPSPSHSLSPVSPYLLSPHEDPPDFYNHQGVRVMNRQPGNLPSHHLPQSHHYNTLRPRSHHQSIKFKSHYRHEEVFGEHYNQGGQRYPPMDATRVFPTIRRVRSLHAPPEDRPVLQRQHCYNKLFSRPGPPEIQQVHPYFENGKVHYRYSPYSNSTQDVDCQRSHQSGFTPSYNIHDVPAPPLKARVKSGCYIDTSGNVIPVCKNQGYQFRDRCFLPKLNDTSDVWNSETSNEYFQSVRREGYMNRMAWGPGQAHSANLNPSQGCLKTEEQIHSPRTNSGRDLLISTEEPGGLCRVTMVSHCSPEHPMSEPNAYQPEHLGTEDQMGARAALLLKQRCPARSYSQHHNKSRPLPPNLSLHKEYSCPDFKHNYSSGAGSSVHHCRKDQLLYRTLSKCYPQEDYVFARSAAQRLHWPERSYSVKGHLQKDRFGLDPNPVHFKRRTHSFVYSQYNSTEGSARAGQFRAPRSGSFHGHSCMPAQGHNLYTTAWTQGGLVQTQMRPEPEVYVE
ncbi:rho GTPase-activating protein 32 isoform X2 [Denticeps clupeoides]|uniref:rho GTPase-activating protein 32 isoform X2 n=1 Tax=Denticeps clupeoides TaxID=299321 RepID=UPI0010A4044A|nr:rho GTPase-activating protein 32-like isoform X2 [Denticeps clupeoides]